MDKNEILLGVVDEYDKLRADAEAKRDLRVKEVYKSIPQIEEIDNKINEIGSNTLNAILSDPDKKGLKEEMKKKFEILKQKRNEILKANSVSEDFDKIIYRCSKCNDTGFIEGKGRCNCFNQRLIDFSYKQSGMYEMIKKQNFDTFDLSLFGKKKFDKEETSHENMKKIKSFCEKYVENFDNESQSLCFYGDTGLGKTFMSCCVAKALMDKEKSVIYISAPKLFKMMDDERFGREREGIEDIYNCDMLIIDDLGTEAESKFVVPSLLEIINERLSHDKKMIISTNLNFKGMEDTYTKRFSSRLLENFTIMIFYGDDIRKKKYK